ALLRALAASTGLDLVWVDGHWPGWMTSTSSGISSPPGHCSTRPGRQPDAAVPGRPAYRTAARPSRGDPGLGQAAVSTAGSGGIGAPLIGGSVARSWEGGR